MPGVPISVVELPLFLRQAAAVWSDAERSDFVDYIARNPDIGDVIPEPAGFAKSDGDGRERESAAVHG